MEDLDLRPAIINQIDEQLTRLEREFSGYKNKHGPGYREIRARLAGMGQAIAYAQDGLERESIFDLVIRIGEISRFMQLNDSDMMMPPAMKHRLGKVVALAEELRLLTVQAEEAKSAEGTQLDLQDHPDGSARSIPDGSREFLRSRIIGTLSEIRTLATHISAIAPRTKSRLNVAGGALFDAAEGIVSEDVTVHLNEAFNTLSSIVGGMDPELGTVQTQQPHYDGAFQQLLGKIGQIRSDYYRLPKVSSSDELVARIHSVTPLQEPAPFQYQMTDKGLSLLAAEPTLNGANPRHVAAEKEYLLEHAERITETLRTSNTSPSLKLAFSAIARKIADDHKLLSLGQEFWTAQAILTAEAGSLMDSLAAELRLHLTNLDRYLNRFAEWNEFVREGLNVQVSEEDEKIISDAAAGIAAQLAPIPTVDPEVPDSLRQTAAWPILHGEFRGGRILARLRSIANLASAVLLRLGSWAGDAAKDNIGTVVIGALFAIATLISGIPGFGWLYQALELARHLVLPGP